MLNARLYCLPRYMGFTSDKLSHEQWSSSVKWLHYCHVIWQVQV